MRRSLALALTLGLLITSALTAQALTPKSGASCKKVGIKAVSKGREFTCIKRGSKLVWNRGVLIKKVTPTPTPTPTSSPTPTPTSSPTPTPTSTVREFTKSEVATHATATDCWSSINGNVYDLTKWVNKHPGGPGAISRLCGVDGTNRFLGQHNGDNSALRELSAYLIGRLKP